MYISIREKVYNPENTIGKKSNCVEHLYCRHIKRGVGKPFKIVNIYINSGFEGEEQFREATTDSIDYYRGFDYRRYANAENKYERGKMILDLMLNCVLNIAGAYGWSQDVFLDAYNECLKAGIENNWWFKNRRFRSPDKKHSIGLWHIYDEDLFEIYLVLFNSRKEEIGRRLVFKDDIYNFDLEAASWDTSTGDFTFKFRGPKKVFRYTIEEILSAEPVHIPGKVNLWFK